MFKRRQLRRSFCGKKESEVSKLVAGPRVYIYDECIMVASRIMEDHSKMTRGRR
jgi:ATP-dependent Clp protease ATP-binding subunit ClpX